MTHEENLTFHISREVRSYRDLPKLLYHFQTKERDEPRPRAGVLRTREFIMKDAYSFDRDAAGLDESYGLYIHAYDRIFDRLGLEWYRVESDVGMMGGHGAHEYMAPCAAGENDVALSDAGYAANVEVASATRSRSRACRHRRTPRSGSRRPGATTVQAVADLLGVPGGSGHQGAAGDRRGARPAARARARRPPPQRDSSCATPSARSSARPRRPRYARVRHRAGLHRSDRLTRARARRPGRSRACRARDRRERARRPPHRGRARTRLRGRVGRRPRVEAGDTDPHGATIRIEPAIEVGNIFKLGTRYAEPLGARYLDEQGTEQLIWMGSYGIGPARIVAAAIEQFADDAGISWPRSVAPFDVELVTLGKEGEEARIVADRLYDELGRRRPRRALRRPRPERRREVRRRRAARLPASPHRRPEEHRGRRRSTSRSGAARSSRSLPLEGAAEAALELWQSLPE